MNLIKKTCFFILFLMVIQCIETLTNSKHRRRLQRNSETPEKLTVDKVNNLFACLDESTTCKKVTVFKIDLIANKNCYTDTIAISFNLTDKPASGFLTEDSQIVQRPIMTKHCRRIKRQILFDIFDC